MSSQVCGLSARFFLLVSAAPTSLMVLSFRFLLEATDFFLLGFRQNSTFFIFFYIIYTSIFMGSEMGLLLLETFYKIIFFFFKIPYT